jgi:hypothetical protein
MASRKPVPPAKKTPVDTAKKASSKPDAESVGPFKAGRTTKDSAYLDRITRAIADDSRHPRHQGVAMQAHHVISATGMHRSKLADKIRKFGYDINLLENLVFIPSTLQGACHLGVQPHRGNHTALVERDAYDDDDHPMDYHDMVAARIRRLELGLTKDCPGYMGGAKEVEARHKLKRQLDELSLEILLDIQKKPRKAPLTKVSMFFQAENPIGCAGTDSTTGHSGDHFCAVRRDHEKRQGPNQRSEGITYRSTRGYPLKVGK